MPERRQAFRREPIEIDLGGEVILSVGPVVWQQRNDFGNEVIRQHVEIINEAVKMYTDPDTGVPQLEAKLGEKFSDPDTLFKLGLDDITYGLLKSLPVLYQNQVVAILLAICEVNELDQLKAMIDPNLTTPTTIGGLLTSLISGGPIDTQKTESGPDSSSLESPETPSEPSPIQSLPSS